MSEEKTEEPTEKRLRDARERGEVSKSVDLTSAIVLISIVGVLFVGQQFLETNFREIAHILFSFFSSERAFNDLTIATYSLGLIGLRVIFLFAGCACLAGIVSLLPQVGFGFTLTPVLPKMDAINPANGLKRIFSIKSLSDLIRTIIKAALIGVVMWKTIESLLPLIGSAIYHPLPSIIQVAWSLLLKLFVIAAALFFLIGIVDYKFQSWVFIRQHRMSHNEIKQEYKESEGDPHVKSARKELAREIAFSPSLKEAIKTANVVVTNPTHYAVALRYRRKERRPPYVVAKGRDGAAADLRLLAKSLGIPIVANPPVARALFTIPVRKNVPESLFSIIAAILRWVEEVGEYQAQQREGLHD